MIPENESREHLGCAPRRLPETPIPFAAESHAIDHRLTELQHHCAELQAENDRLREAQAVPRRSHDRYFELYDLAPLPLLTLDDDQVVREANLTAARLLQTDQHRIVGQPFALFLEPTAHTPFAQLCQAASESGEDQTGEFALCGTPETPRGMRIHRLVPDHDCGSPLLSIIISNIDESHQRRQAYERSEARYRSIVETTLEGVMVTDTNRIITYVNDRVVELLGYPRAEILHRPVHDFLDPTLNEKVPTCGDRRRRGTREQCFIRQNGERLCILVAMSTMGEGEAAHHLMMLTDISARKALEQDLRQITKRLTLAQQAGKIAAWEWDMGSQQIEWSEQLGALLGLEGAGEGTSIDTLLQRVHPLDREMVKTTVRKSIDKGCDFEIELRMVWLDGSVRWLAATGSVVRDDRGEGGRLIGVLQNITARKVAEEELRAARRRLEEQLESQNTRLSDTEHFLTIEITDRVRAEKNLTRRQQALEAVYAISMVHTDSPEAAFDQIAGSIAVILDVPFATVAQLENEELTIVSQFSDGQLLEKPDNEWAALPPSEYVWRNRSPYQCADDLQRQFPHIAALRKTSYHSYVGVPIVDDVGDVRGIIMSLDKRYRVFEPDEIHLIEIFAGYIAHEYTRKRLEAQLLQSEEMRMLGQLTSGVAHEVRNPLSAITAIAEALFRRLGDNPEYDPFKRHLYNQVKRLSTLMEELLVLGRPVRPTEFRLHKVGHLVDLALDCWHQAPHARERQVKIETEGDADQIHINANAEKIHQVLVNLLDNATHHSPSDEEIRIAIDRPEEHRVRLRVIDRGSGIPPHQLSRLMDPFFTTRKGGSGLGLSIVRHLVECHGGTVRIHNSVPGPGATVELRLPFSS